jgi:isoleucyl-tRNA synthetase
VLRLWVSSVDYFSDIPLGKNILKQMSDVYRKIRNTARFLIGNLHDFDPTKDEIAYNDLPELDRYMLHRMTEVFDEVTDAYKTYEFFRVFQAIQNFCVVDLSNFYLDIAKDRLYISAPNAPRRRSCQTVLAIALENLAHAIAPVLSHMAEDIWQFLPYATPHQSVFEAGWVKLEPAWVQPNLGAKWAELRNIRQDVNAKLEEARISKLIGASLEAKVTLAVFTTEWQNILEKMNPETSDIETSVDELRYLFLTSKVEFYSPTEDISSLSLGHPAVKAIRVEKAEGHKCDRCWNYSTYVGQSQKHAELCDRCETVIEEMAASGQLTQVEDGSWQPV